MPEKRWGRCTKGAEGVLGEELWTQGATARQVWEGRELLEEEAIAMYASLADAEVRLYVLGARARPIAQDKSWWGSLHSPSVWLGLDLTALPVAKSPLCQPLRVRGLFLLYLCQYPLLQRFQYSHGPLHRMPVAALTPSCSSPLRNPMLSRASPILQEHTGACPDAEP